jgi:thiol peroxidase
MARTLDPNEEASMARITLGGNPCNTVGDLPAVGSAAPDFTLTKTDMSPLTLSELKGKRVVLNIFPSVGTGVCAAAMRRFNEEAGKLDNTIVVCVSMDLPFAHDQFCAAEGLEDVVPVSDFRTRAFGDTYGVRILDGKFEGLLARSVVVVDADGKVIHSQLVGEIANEPDYDAALGVLV